MTIYHSSDTTIGYLEETTEFGVLETNPVLQPITGANALTRGLELDPIIVNILGQKEAYKILKGQHDPVLSVEFNIQNMTLPALVEQITKSYSFVILDTTGDDIFRVYEGCRVNSFRIGARVRDAIMGTMVLTPRSYRDESSITGLTWGDPWTETPYAWYDARVELLKEVLLDAPSGTGTGPYTCANSPFCDKDEDGTIDDTGDIIVYDNEVPETPADVDSSLGKFNLTEAPVGAVTADYVYEIPLTDILSVSLTFENDFRRIRNISLTGDKARAIREGRLTVSGDITFSAESTLIVDAIIADTSYWGFQLKLGVGENGVCRFRAKTAFKWDAGEYPSEADELITGRVPFRANDFNIF